MFSAANPNSVAFVPSIEWFAVSCNTHTHTHTLTHCDTHWHTHRLTDWQTDRLTDWQTDTLTHWQTQTLTHWHTDTLTHSHTRILTYSHMFEFVGLHSVPPTCIVPDPQRGDSSTWKKLYHSRLWLLGFTPDVCLCGEAQRWSKIDSQVLAWQALWIGYAWMFYRGFSNAQSVYGC